MGIEAVTDGVVDIVVGVVVVMDKVDVVLLVVLLVTVLNVVDVLPEDVVNVLLEVPALVSAMNDKK